MINPSDVVRIPDTEFWRMNPKEDYTYSIEWTPKLTGWVRAKLDSIDQWHYVQCMHCQHAEGLGLAIIARQEKARDIGDGYDHDYQGA